MEKLLYSRNRKKKTILTRVNLDLKNTSQGITDSNINVIFYVCEGQIVKQSFFLLVLVLISTFKKI